MDCIGRVEPASENERCCKFLIDETDEEDGLECCEPAMWTEAFDDGMRLPFCKTHWNGNQFFLLDSTAR